MTMHNMKTGNTSKTRKSDHPSFSEKDWWLEKIKSNPRFVVIAPESIVTPDMFVDFSIKNPKLPIPLYAVPKSMRTEEVCKAAFALNPENVKDIPKKFLTYELFASGISYYTTPQYSWDTDTTIEDRFIAFLSWADDKDKIPLIQEWERQREAFKKSQSKRPEDIVLPKDICAPILKPKWWEFWKWL